MMQVSVVAHLISRRVSSGFYRYMNTAHCGSPFSKRYTRKFQTCVNLPSLSTEVNGSFVRFISPASGAPVSIHSWWLRDHCRCDQCYNNHTFQRNLMFHDIDPNIQPFDIELQGNVLSVLWPDDHKSTYNVDWLLDHIYPGNTNSKSEKFLWDSESIREQDVPAVSYGTFMKEDEELSVLLKSLLRYGFGIVKDAPATYDGTRSVVERVSFIQVFHLVHHDGEGGETLLVDGFHAAARLRREHPDAFYLLTKTPLIAEYQDETARLQSLNPVIRLNPMNGEIEQIRFNHYDRAPISTVDQTHVPKLYEALTTLSREIADPRNEHWFKLQPGMVLFIDNWRVLHGRSSFTGNRHLISCYLPRDDWLSKARLLNCL